MDTILEQLSLNFEDSFSPLTYVIYILICSALLYVLSIVYRSYGQSISNRNQLGKVLMVVGLTTFIIISIVKSSLALSLGLVGALSIVRFRTAIKEPEELGYFFMAIALGLGMGANQLLPTLIGFVVLMLIIVLQSKGMGGNSTTQNLLVALQNPPADNNQLVSLISDTVAKHSKQLEVKRIKSGEKELAMNFLVKVTSLKDLSTIQQQLQAIDKTIDITFIDSTL